MEIATQAASTGIAQDGRVHLNAALLKVLRQGRALSQEALADLCFSKQLQVSVASIKRAEAGKSVLYRTARHLAQVFEINPEQLRAAPQLALEGSGARARAGPSLWSEQAPLRYVIELHAQLHAPVSAHARTSLAQLASRFGGQLADDGQWRLSVLFGLARACLGDAARAMGCALDIARQRTLGIRGGMALRLVRWDGARAHGGAELPAAAGGGAPAIWVERALALQLRDAFLFTPPYHGSAWQRFIAAGDGAMQADCPMVGRDAELRQFKGIVETLHEHQRGHVVYVRGMAGVGKTRLLHAFRALGHLGGLQTHHCSVQDDNGALTQLSLNPAGATSDEVDMLAGLRALIDRSTVACPLLITIDDIHRCDTRLFSPLAALIMQTRDAPVIWALSSRTEQDPAGTAFRPHLSELPLSVFEMAPLSEREARIMAHQFAGVDDAHRQRCVERSRGNPLFLTLLLASAHEQLLPDSLKHLVQIRMDELFIEHRRALHIAAVIGPGVTLSALRGALCEPDYDPASAVRHGLLRHCGSDSCVFAHALVMECIYDAIDPAERRRLHDALAPISPDSDPAPHAHQLRGADNAGVFHSAFAAPQVDTLAGQFDAKVDYAMVQR